MSTPRTIALIVTLASTLALAGSAMAASPEALSGCGYAPYACAAHAYHDRWGRSAWGPHRRGLPSLSAQQRAQMRELLRQARLSSLTDRQEIVDERFALQRLALAPKWNAQAAQRHAARIGDAVAHLIVERMALHRRLQALFRQGAGAGKS
ncbi:MAG: hypothetical protein M0T84_00580 [Betaproteobacteria bacterium]|nr:hypothetical protein [Betaproteobacteria bacterium]